MGTFGTLYRYECKKIWSKKIVKISLALCLVFTMFGIAVRLLGNEVIDGVTVDSNYHMYQVDKAYAQALNGRKIDQQLLEETIAAYRKIPETPGKHYMGTKEYQEYARPYSEIFNYVAGTTPMMTSELLYSWKPDENDYYQKRQEYLRANWKDMRLSEREQRFWQQQEKKIAKPFVYQEHKGYEILFSIYQTVGLLVMLLTAIGLSGIFSEEHARRTDQLILSSTHGKTSLYLAKILAGISFAAGVSFLFLAVSVAVTFLLYGGDGFGAAFQLIYKSNCAPLSCGQAVLIAYGNMLAAVLIMSTAVMVLSELFHSNIAALSVIVGCLTVGQMVFISEQYRVVAQIWNWLPGNFIAVWNVFGCYTLSVFGHTFTAWQIMPIIYLAVSVVIAAAGKSVYRRYQVAGR